MTDQKLVDELEKAINDEAYDGGMGYMGEERFKAYVRTLAETAAAVFEKAHTPTDDELHALGDIIEHVQTMWEADRDQYIEPLAEFTARGILAAGFRRSEVPEPSRIGCNVCGESLPDGEPHVCSEPQGEPSDAQVLAAAESFFQAFFHDDDGGFWEDLSDGARSIWVDRMRAALRAAGGVR